MKNYCIVKIKDSDYEYLIIAANCINPITELDDIQRDLGTVSGTILFDLTLINGINSNRYLSATVHKGVFARDSFKKVSEVEEQILTVSQNFFMENSDAVERGTITKPLKYLLKTGEKIGQKCT